MSKHGDRATGPYEHGNQFRVRIVIDGKKGYRGFKTEREAWDYISEFRAATENRGLGATIEEHLTHLATYGRAPSGNRKRQRPLGALSIGTLRHRLMALLRVVEGDRPLAAVTPSAAQRLYDKRVGECRADTHHGELAGTHAFFDWCVERDYTDRNPFSGVEPQGDRSAGKPSLSTDGARAFLEAATGERSMEGRACVVALVLGLRASELCARLVGDLDDRGGVLVIPKAKTRAGVRRIKLPPMVRALVAEQTAGKKPEDRIFPLSRYALHYHTVRLCKAAGVKRVTPHGLRKSMTENAVEVGGSLDSMLGTMGWASVAVGRKHYLEPGVEESAAASGREISLWGSDGVSVVDRVSNRPQSVVMGGTTDGAERHWNLLRVQWGLIGLRYYQERVLGVGAIIHPAVAETTLHRLAYGNEVGMGTMTSFPDQSQGGHQ